MRTMARSVAAGAAIACVVAIVITGCNKPPGINPWRDDSIPPSAYGTASSDYILSANVPPTIRQRNTEPINGPDVSWDVPHYPLWWEDSFDDQGDNNNTYAWTWQDYFAMPYGLARFLLNTTALPVSAIVTPPFTPIASDGIVGHGIAGPNSQDARPGYSPDPTAGPEDFGYTDNATTAIEAHTGVPTTQP